MYMDRWECGGSLRITVNDERPGVFRIRLTHEEKHAAYCDISASAEVMELVEKLKDLPAGDVSTVAACNIMNTYET